MVVISKVTAIHNAWDRENPTLVTLCASTSFTTGTRTNLAHPCISFSPSVKHRSPLGIGGITWRRLLDLSRHPDLRRTTGESTELDRACVRACLIAWEATIWPEDPPFEALGPRPAEPPPEYHGPPGDLWAILCLIQFRPCAGVLLCGEINDKMLVVNLRWLFGASGVFVVAITERISWAGLCADRDIVIWRGRC
jgi:hypothetical protein